MSDIGGLTLDRRHICVSVGPAATVVATLAEALGYRVTRGGIEDAQNADCDLWVLETTQPSEVGGYAGGAPVLVVASQRLRGGQQQRLCAAGADRVLDVGACLLEVAFGLTDLLFDTGHAQRRYAEAFSQITVRFADDNGKEHVGCLTGITARGARVIAQTSPCDGALLTLTAEFGPWSVPIRSRVAFVGDELKPGFGVEFALDHQQLAPRIESFVSASSRPHTPTPTAGLPA